jgi:hypothetical protein
LSNPWFYHAFVKISVGSWGIPETRWLEDRKSEGLGKGIPNCCSTTINSVMLRSIALATTTGKRTQE